MLHCVWGTKKKQPLLQRDKRIVLIEHILDNARKKNIFIDCINGHTDHLHALISMGANQNISDLMQNIKGESAYWANNAEHLFKTKLEWAEKYFAVSVSESQLGYVRRYIANQEEHHSKITFEKECEIFLEKYGFQLG